MMLDYNKAQSENSMSMLHRQFNKVFDNPVLDTGEVLKLTVMIQIDVAEQQKRTADALGEIAAALRKNGGMPVDFDRLFNDVQKSPTFVRS